VQVRLVTERLVLREFEEGTGGQDWPTKSHPRYLRYYAWSVRDEPALRDLVGGFVARQGDEPRHVFRLAIALPAENSRLIGNCGV
jgi:hypothetical protein